MTVLPVEKVAEVFRNFDALGSKLASTTAEGWNVNLPDEDNHYHWQMLWDVLDLRPPRRRRRGLSAAAQAALAALPEGPVPDLWAALGFRSGGAAA